MTKHQYDLTCQCLNCEIEDTGIPYIDNIFEVVGKDVS